MTMNTSTPAGSIADLIALEHAAADEAHVTGLPLVHCQQYVQRNAALVASLAAQKASREEPSHA